MYCFTFFFCVKRAIINFWDVLTRAQFKYLLPNFLSFSHKFTSHHKLAVSCLALALVLTGELKEFKSPDVGKFSSFACAK